MSALADLWRAVADFWATYQAPIILGTGGVLLVVLLLALWRFQRTRERSKVVSTIAAVIVMAWTSEGLLNVGLTKFQLPPLFAVMTFFVFEAMMLASGLKAEEHRRVKGVPGAAGKYVFVLAIASGIVSAFGAHNTGEIFLRVVLPSLAVGQWWIFLTAERDDDKPEWKLARLARIAARQASWAISPNTILVRVGLKNAGEVTVTEAQRQYLIRRMVVVAETVNTARWSWTADRAQRRLRRLARRADPTMIAAVELQVDIAATVAARLDRRHPAVAPLGDTPRPALTAPLSPGFRNPGGTPDGTPGNGSGTAGRHPSGTGTGTPDGTVPKGVDTPRRNPDGTPTDTPSSTPRDTATDTLAKGVDTPARNPGGTPGRNGSAIPPAPRLTSDGTPAGTPRGTGTGTPDEFPADGVLLAILRDPARVPREPGGIVPTKRAMNLLGTGRTRAIRLLKAEGLYRDTPAANGSDTPGGTPHDTGSAEGSDDDQERVPRVNGHHPVELIGAAP